MRTRHWIVGFVLLATSACSYPPPTAPSPPPAAPSPVFASLTRIDLGEVIRGTIGATDPICDLRWDARAPCKRFLLTVPASGTLTLSLTATMRDDVFDLMLLG